MNLKQLLFPSLSSASASAGLIPLRLFAGMSLAGHGWGKIQDPFHWMGADAGTPSIFQALAAIAEFFGGIAVVIGALTVIASFGIACTMVVAINTHLSRGDPAGKWELAGMYLVIALLLMLAGPGKFAVDALAQRWPSLGKGTAGVG